jgi:CheY-like chemotaxis protein
MIRVVCIDDESDTDAMASRFEDLEAHGIKVTPIVSVPECIERLRALRSAFDAIVIDQIMPPRDTYSLDETEGGTKTGLRLLKDIRKEFPQVPVIVVSVSEPPTESEMRSLGIAEFFKKPVVDLEALARAVKRVVKE